MGAGFAATRKGCSYSPFSGSTLGALATELRGYVGTRASLHFAPGAGLPATLVRKLVRVRRAEIRARGKLAAPLAGGHPSWPPHFRRAAPRLEPSGEEPAK